LHVPTKPSRLRARHPLQENDVALTAPAPVSTELTDEVRRIVRLVLAELEEPCLACTAIQGPRPLNCGRCDGRTVIPTALGAYALNALKGVLSRRTGLVGRAGTVLAPKPTRMILDAARAEWEVFAVRHGQ